MPQPSRRPAAPPTPAARPPAPARTLALAALLAAGSCSTVPMTPHPRPARPLPAAVAARYALPGPVVEESLVPIGSDADGRRFFRGRLRSGDEEAEFNLVLPAGAGQGPAGVPFAVALPILAGGSELMWIISGFLTARGWAVAWTERAGSPMRAPQRGPDLEQLFRRTILHNRMLIDWARRDPRLDGDHPVALGVSLGGMVASVLLAVEPALAGGAVVISGGDLPDLVPESDEGRVAQWVRWRAEVDGAGTDEIARELERELRTDPARLACHVDTEDVLMVSATLDTVVPRDNQDALWEAFGRPRRMFVPLAHYSSALAILPIMHRVHRFLTDRRQHGIQARRGGLASAVQGSSDGRPTSDESPSTAPR